MLRFLAEIDRRDRVLSRVGWLHVGLLAVMLVAAAFDSRQLLGVNVWIKPIKFAASITIYVWTLAWLMEYIARPAWCKSLVRWGVATAMVVEIACIAGQSLRGVTSHFNSDSAFDVGVFAVMGLMIGFNTLLEGLVLVLFLRPYPALPPAYLLGIRLGLAGALLSAAVGSIMIAHGAHTVGAADGGAGMWLVNWSTRAGDLRVSHAIGLHALQILPVTGYLLTRWLAPQSAVRAIVLVAAAYAAIFGWTFVEALEGRPLVGDPPAATARTLTFPDKVT